MKNPLFKTALAAAVAVPAFIVGTSFDFSPQLAWMYEDPGRTIGALNSPLAGTLDDYFRPSVFLHATALDITMNMTAEQKAGQLLMPAWEKGTSLETMTAMIERYHLGGVMVLRNDATTEQTSVLYRAAMQQIQNQDLKPFLSIDAEPSLLRYRIPQADYKTQTASLINATQAYSAAEDIVEITAPYSYNLNFAPVYDSGVNTAIIGNRAFATDTQTISTRAGAFVDGMKDGNMIPTAKHFPGHGYAAGDTHKTLESVPGDLPERGAFQNAINNKVPMIMVGHLAVDGGEHDTQGLPATLSSTVMEDLLRDEMRYKGVVITDGMVMGALNEFQNVDVQAIVSGADIALMPRNTAAAHAALVQRMQTDNKFAELINQKVYRVVRLKLAQQWAQ